MRLAITLWMAVMTTRIHRAFITGVFTSLVRNIGVRGLEFIEVYGIEPWAMDHLEPYALILCFLWRKDSHRPADFDDPAAEKVWFANQLSDDSCATHAILNVLLNCPGIDIGSELEAFRYETEEMSPVVRTLRWPEQTDACSRALI